MKRRLGDWRLSAAALLLMVGCAAAHAPGDYRLASVPDVSVVGEQAYMGWFADHAVTDATREFVVAHAPALDAALHTVQGLTAGMADCRISTRRDPSRKRPALKEPHKVEEKIYRMVLESEAMWAQHRAGLGPPGCFPAGVTPRMARQQVYSSDPRAPCALRDIAGMRIVVSSLETLRDVAGALRRAYGDQVIRFKDYIGAQYRGDGYRSVHFVVLEGGQPVEIQLRTVRQQRWAKWEHSLIYKGRFKHDESAREYARKVADRLYDMDQGTCREPCRLPVCPGVLEAARGCFPGIAPKPPAP
jgi:hypothetical protein